MPANRLSPALQNGRLFSSVIKGPALMFGSALLFAATDIIIKIIGPAFRVWDIAFFRFGGGIVLMIILFGWFANLFKGNNTRLLIIRGISGAMAFLSLVGAIQLLPLSSAIVLLYSFPAFAALFSAIIFGERISILQLVCIFGTLVGVAILLDFSPKGNLLGQIIGLLAGMFAGIAVCFIKKLRESNGPVIIYFYFCLVGGVIAFPAFMANPRLPTTAGSSLLVLILVLIFLGAQLLMNQGFKYCRSWEGGLFLSSEALFTSIAGICFLGDPVTWHFWAGGSLIVGSVVLLNTAVPKSGESPGMAAGTPLSPPTGNE
jgi:drug/metabolite transporter (DMT)-like permease